MSIISLDDNEAILNNFHKLLNDLHTHGPITGSILESLSYYKYFHSDLFSQQEENIISSLGLFYKIKEKSNLYSFLLGGFGEQYKKDYGAYLTPVQASIREAIEVNNTISISAPTSAGKSYSIRDFIYSQGRDAVVVVPSRALIAEYMKTMQDRFNNDKKVMISPFVDKVFTGRNLKRIFILTPERSRDLFKNNFDLDIGVFFLDEAQASDDKSRGVNFDIMVRKINKKFPDAKIIFAHPFIKNPEAQIKKHSMPSDKSFSHQYTQGSVGKIYIYKHKSNGNFYYFSPFNENGHRINKCIKYKGSFADFAFNGKHSVLIYVSKSSIYNGNYLNGFSTYIKRFTENLHPEATKIIKRIEHILGSNNKEHRSNLVELMRKGVVTHHGSIPLEVRFLIEEFIRLGFAKICFATSTLAQGVNMPFDIVWLDSNRFQGGDDRDRSLSFKNLIGRAGRLTDKAEFDYGFVFTKNPLQFSKYIKEDYVLDERSVIDQPLDESNIDSIELIESLKNNTFDEDKQIPISKMERLSSNECLRCCREVLDLIYPKNLSTRENLHGSENKNNRSILYENLRSIFEVSINRNLFEGESSVFQQAVNILIFILQGRSFREIIGLRFSFIARKQDNYEGAANFSQPASTLPDYTLKNKFSLFPANKRARDVGYDSIVFDTYDYLDQVISFSLSEPFIAAFKVFQDVTKDPRAEKIIELFRFGTNDEVQVLLMRYGFSPEVVADIEEYISSIDQDNISFKPEIVNAPDDIQKLVEWYLPDSYS